MKEGRGQRGSTLGWVVIVMMVLLIFLIAALTVTSSLVVRNQKSHQKAQAELTVNSLAQAFVKDINKQDGIRQMLERAVLEGVEVIALEGLDSDMGEVSLDISYEQEEERLFIRITAVLGAAKEQITVIVKCRIEDDMTETAYRTNGEKQASVWEVLEFREGKEEGLR